MAYHFKKIRRLYLVLLTIITAFSTFVMVFFQKPFYGFLIMFFLTLALNQIANKKGFKEYNSLLMVFYEKCDIFALHDKYILLLNQRPVSNRLRLNFLYNYSNFLLLMGRNDESKKVFDTTVSIYGKIINKSKKLRYDRYLVETFNLLIKNEITKFIEVFEKLDQSLHQMPPQFIFFNQSNKSLYKRLYHFKELYKNNNEDHVEKVMSSIQTDTSVYGKSLVYYFLKNYYHSIGSEKEKDYVSFLNDISGNVFYLKNNASFTLNDDFEKRLMMIQKEKPRDEYTYISFLSMTLPIFLMILYYSATGLLSKFKVIFIVVFGICLMGSIISFKRGNKLNSIMGVLYNLYSLLSFLFY